MPAVTSALIGGGASLLGGLFGGRSARRAAQTQADAQIRAAQIAAEETGGAANATLPCHTHTATVTDPGHAHGIAGPSSLSGGFGTLGGTGAGTVSASAVTGISVANSTEGASATNANYQPYITVYMWKRTA